MGWVDRRGFAGRVGVGLVALGWGAADAHASVCSTFPSPPLACDGVLWTTEIWSIDAAQLNGYANCGGLPQPGPEWIFPFLCPYDGPVTVTVGGTDCDVDLYVLNGPCQPGAGCVAYSMNGGFGAGPQDQATFDCRVGDTRYVVLEAYDLANNPTLCPWDSPLRLYRYTDLAVLAICEEICGDGFDNDQDGATDCSDADCPCAEDCQRPGDEDVDGLADCADADCWGQAGCCDVDGDGADAATRACGGDDCDDQSPSVFPGQVEAVADGVDQDCDGVDACWTDRDGDGFGVPPAIAGDNLVCGDRSGESDNAVDCLDRGAGSLFTYPGAYEGVGDGLDQNCDGVDHCFRDYDGDTWGSGVGTPGPGMDCDAYPGWSSRWGDCRDAGQAATAANPDAVEVCDGIDNDCDRLVDDRDPDVGAVVSLWPDLDGDGWGGVVGEVQTQGCAVPAGFAARTGDCDDGDGARSPGTPEVPYDGLDQDCSGADLVDVDADGVAGVAGAGLDCDDLDPLIQPGRAEVANGRDDDCDGSVDDGTAQGDDDGDGFAEVGGDCDDALASVRPGAIEACDGVDQDCDGGRDEGTSCVDDDGDGFSEDAGDCQDDAPAVHPGVPENPSNGVDDDCDGRTDVGDVDVDGDGYARFAGDCDDEDPLVSPVAEDVPNGKDDDCDARVDEGTDRFDDDFDGFSEALGDCYDGDATVFPGAPETLNGVDDDCDGRVDETGASADEDRDGWAALDGDCDDADRARFPGAAERGNGLDDDCDGEVDEGIVDVDGDGFSQADGDCDDAQGWVRPDAVEVCDGLDNDCDGATDPGCAPAGVLPGGGACVGCASAPRGASPASLAWAWTSAVWWGRRRRGAPARDAAA